MKEIGWLQKLDEKAERKGMKTLWQFVKFFIVSLLTTGVQLLLVNVLYFYLKDFTEPLPSFLSTIFTDATMGSGHSNWGYLLPFFVSNFVANTIAISSTVPRLSAATPLGGITSYISSSFYCSSLSPPIFKASSPMG